MTKRNSQTYDNLMLLKDAGAVTATAAAQVGGVARVLDLGANTAGANLAGGARMQAKVVIDVSALDVADANETYRVALEGCNAIGFGSGVVELASVLLTGAGRDTMPFDNQIGDTVYQFVRIKHTIGGTTPSVNYTAFIAKE